MPDETPQDVAPPADDLLYDAWCVIANAGHNQGGWQTQDPEWVAAAERWRDRWHASLDGQGWADDLAAADAAVQLDAHGRLRWAPPTRFDPDDRSTWPEDGQRVLVWGPGRWHYDEWSTAEFLIPSTGPGWRRDWDGIHDHLAAESGQPWLPLPPTQGGA